MKAKIYETVINFIKKHNLIEKKSKVIIALSGGPDSVFALHFFNQFKKKYDLEIVAAHVNHNLRGKDSDKDQIFCEKLCNKLEIPLFIKSADIKSISKEEKLSVEEAARKVRYIFFEKLVEEEKADLVITAHNSDDNTETILLNLIKGTGLNGLSGIPIKRDKIIRPILALSKKDILEFLISNSIKFRIDKTNEQTDFERNKIRNKVAPVLLEINPSLNNSLRNFADNIANINCFIQNEVEKRFLSSISFNQKEILIDINLFNERNVSIASLVIKKLFEEKLKISFASNDAEELKNLANLVKGSKTKLRSNFIAVREEKIILICKVKNDKFNPIKISLNEKVEIDDYEILLQVIQKNENLTKFTEIISGDKIDDIFILRRWKNGDKFIPLGMKGFKKISDFLTDAKIKSFEKKDHLILTNRNEIVYVLGLRIDDRYKLTESTKKKIGICLKRTCRN